MSELERVKAKFEAGHGGHRADRSTEIVEIDILHRRVKMRWVFTMTKEHIVEYAQIKLQQIINDYIGEQK